ncbi:hypothetical protein [Dyella flagellata]|uniref:Flagellar protein FliT n=1 Tax=Dyella flagellata TaxID=1867833 RepID=A0ABQ5X7Z0_9GAMM|nr:hypothetical protein [Dyella flagellata]GLQ86779.1 hypothetical protein GCM10007898_03450 [Dyella flagellata]
MNGSVQDDLQQALALTIEMCDAAAAGNWTLVIELDARRQLHLQHVQSGSLGLQHQELLATLQAHNLVLLERAQQAHEAVEQELSRHQYKHRALSHYVTSSF